MGKRIGHSRNCSRGSYLTKPLVVCKEETTIMHQRPSDAAPNWFRTNGGMGATQIKVVPGIDRGISMKLVQRSMEVITSGLGYHLNDAAAIPAVLRTGCLGQDSDLCQFIQPRKSPEAPAGEKPKTGSFASRPSIRTFVQLGRIPLIDTCPVLPFESSEGALLGVGATPGTTIMALKRSRPFRGSSARLLSVTSPPTVDVVLSIAVTPAVTVTCCG